MSQNSNTSPKTQPDLKEGELVVDEQRQSNDGHKEELYAECVVIPVVRGLELWIDEVQRGKGRREKDDLHNRVVDRHKACEEVKIARGVHQRKHQLRLAGHTWAGGNEKQVISLRLFSLTRQWWTIMLNAPLRGVESLSTNCLIWTDSKGHALYYSAINLIFSIITINFTIYWFWKQIACWQLVSPTTPSSSPRKKLSKY